MTNFKSNALTAVLYAAAAIQVLAVRGVRYYTKNEQQILGNLSEATLCFLAGVSIVYARGRDVAVAAYDLGKASRELYTSVAPQVKERVLELRERF